MSNDFPRKGSALYGMIKGDKVNTKGTLQNWKKYNKIVVFLYQVRLLPLLGLGRFILLLYTKGRRSGKTIVTPLECRPREDSIILFSARGKWSDWYRNLVAYPGDVKIKVGFQTIEPFIEIIEDHEAIEEYLKWYILEHPRSSRFLFGWNPKKDDLETTDLTSLTIHLKIIKLDTKTQN